MSGYHAAIQAAIAAATFTGRNAATDEANLLLKVDAAEAKRAEGEVADAIPTL